MTRTKFTVFIVVIVASVAIGLACDSGVDSHSNERRPPGVIETVLVSVETESNPIRTEVTSEMKSRPLEETSLSSSTSIAKVPFVETLSSNSGIWVTGHGRVNLEPDLAILDVSVEAFDKTVLEASRQASRAISDIIMSLNSAGIQGTDIRTSFFNISPQYEYMEVLQKGKRIGKQVLVGYRVTNSIAVKIRALASIGNIIDDAVDAGGDAVRIQNVSFTVEEPEIHMEQLRELAINDALAKADQFAILTGSGRGPLIFIAESNGSGSLAKMDLGRAAFSEATLTMPTTPISGGELELKVSIQAVFGIIP